MGRLGQFLGAARSFSWEEWREQLTVTPENLEVTLSLFVGIFFLIIITADLQQTLLSLPGTGSAES